MADDLVQQIAEVQLQHRWLGLYGCCCCEDRTVTAITHPLHVAEVLADRLNLHEERRQRHSMDEDLENAGGIVTHVQGRGAFANCHLCETSHSGTSVEVADWVYDHGTTKHGLKCWQESRWVSGWTEEQQ